MELEKLLVSINKEFPDNAIDIGECLDLLIGVLSDTVDSTGKKMEKYFSEKEYDKANSLIEIAKGIEVYGKKLEEINSILESEEISLDEEMDEETETKAIPNYAEYTVDNNIEHSLYEDFTHKRPFGFKLNSKNAVMVNTWQDILATTCEYLIAIDREKFMRFEDDKSMNGKKNKYFSVSSAGIRKPRLIADAVYIETNQSANSIRNLIIKLLRAYSFNIADYKIYLRADYTDIGL